MTAILHTAYRLLASPTMVSPREGQGLVVQFSAVSVYIGILKQGLIPVKECLSSRIDERASQRASRQKTALSWPFKPAITRNCGPDLG